MSNKSKTTIIMKRSLLLIAIIAMGFAMFAQQTTRTLNWDDTDRGYIEYLPSSYTGDTPTPIVFALHGLGDDMNNFYNSLSLNTFSEATGWIIITPQALMATVPVLGEIGNAWNSGAGAEDTPLGTIVLNEGVDDAGFLIAVLDSAENHLNINTDSVFFIGFSMGGFMSNRMGIEHGDRITAIASVSGTIGKFLSSEPSVNLNALHIHGTADGTVSYDNADINFGSGMIYSVGDGALDCVETWRSFNNCDETAIVNIFPDTQADGKTFERYVYLNGDNDSYVAHIKVNEGDHEWYFTPQNDMDYFSEIYKFFTNTMDFTVGISSTITNNEISLYPNPAKDYINIEIGDNENAVLRIFDILGTTVRTSKIKSRANIDIADLPEGMYIFRLYTNKKTIDKKVIINR